MDSNGKNAYIKRNNLNGTIGCTQHSYVWEQGWTTFQFYEADNDEYILKVKETGIDAENKNAYVKRIH